MAKEDIYILVSSVDRELGYEQFTSLTSAQERMKKLVNAHVKDEEVFDSDWEAGDNWAYINGKYSNIDYRIFKLA